VASKGVWLGTRVPGQVKGREGGGRAKEVGGSTETEDVCNDKYNSKKLGRADLEKMLATLTEERKQLWPSIAS
jgi:hypothetical protein